MAAEKSDLKSVTNLGVRPIHPVNNRRSRSPAGRSNRRIFWNFVRLAVFMVVIGGFWFFLHLPEYFERAGLNLVRVRGLVTIDGQPADAARIVFVPMEKSFEPSLQPISVATTEKDGTFSLKTLAGKPGAVRGRHLVYVLPAPDLTNIGAKDPELTQSLPQGPGTQPDAWRDAADLLGYWVSANPVRDEAIVPFFGTQTLEIKLQR
jgi:hypothetical protein